MGHRALIAYERPDSTYNLHYTHWGACNLRLKHDLSEETPFGGEEPNEQLQSIFTRLLDAMTDTDIDDILEGLKVPNQEVDVEPRDIRISIEEIITSRLDYLHHEVFYVVDSEFSVTAYRTHWYGLQYDSRVVDDGPTIGNGALRTIRWYDGEPVGDSFALGEFRALKNVAGDMIDQGVFSPAEAREYLSQKLSEWVKKDQELLIRAPDVIQ